MLIGLLELDPDFATVLPAEERELASRISVPVHTVGGHTDADVHALLGRAGAFGAVVLDGWLMQRLRVRGHVGIRLLGAGDIVMPSSDLRPMCMAESELTASAGTRLALFDTVMLSAVRRWPAVMLGVLRRVGESSEMLEAQLVICQLPRVDQRVSAVLWLFAERWGRVTPLGTYLPIDLTHETLGALIGARRPTVTLALAELADRGELIRNETGWLLLGPSGDSPAPARETITHMPELHTPQPSPWQQRTRPAENGSHESVVAYSDATRTQSRWLAEVARSARLRAEVLKARSHRLRSPAAGG